jgi:membrane-associated phospholipid phosphatase
MKNKKVATGGIIFAFILLLSFYFDEILFRLTSLIRTEYLDTFFLWVTHISSEIVLVVFLTLLFILLAQKRKWVLPLWVTLISSAAISFFLKSSIQRSRPYQLGLVSAPLVLEKASHLVWNFSFPSFHTVLVFSALPLINKEFPKFKYVWIIFAVLVAFSRIYFGLHFLSDMVAGALIGYFLGYFIIEIEKDNKFLEGIYRKLFG